jgi:hypothetical protein
MGEERPACIAGKPSGSIWLKVETGLHAMQAKGKVSLF